jgi:hypothetical protein
VSDLEQDRLFKAWADAASRTTPELSADVRRRVLAAYGERGRRPSFPAAYRWALGGLAIAVAVAVVLFVRAPAASSFQVAGRGGQVGTWLDATPTNELALHFSEGTRVSLGKGSRGRVTRLTPRGAHIELGSGAVDAEVTHVAGADWSFDAGPFEVTVTGTKLDVSWLPDAGKFELSVSRGSVRVTGPFILQPQEVRAGQVCRVDLNRRLMELGPLTAELASPVPEAPSAALPPSSEPKPAEFAAPQPSSLGGRAVSAESLLEEARAARMAGRPDLERAALLACRRRAPGQPAAAQAAYLLGRSSAPAGAAIWFETYLHEMPQGLLAREAAGRLIESYKAAGNVSALQSAASRYLTRYPNGPHAAMARQVLATGAEGQE